MKLIQQLDTVILLKYFPFSDLHLYKSIICLAKFEIATIKQAMEMLSSKTGRCITFVPRTAEHTTWIKIISGSGCWSYV